MRYYGRGESTEYLLEVRRGHIPGVRLVTERGHTPSQAAGSTDVDISEFGDLIYLTNAEPIDCVSTSAADVQTTGIGAHTFLMEGINENGAAVEEIIQAAIGSSPPLAFRPTSWWRPAIALHLGGLCRIS